MRILKLAVKEKYFNEIKQGTKTEEYRLVKKYWGKRLLKEYDEVHITLGYPRKDEKEKILNSLSPAHSTVSDDRGTAAAPQSAGAKRLRRGPPPKASA